VTADSIDEATLAPLDELIAILPQIEPAKERAELGDVLQKATRAAERYAEIPERLENLSTLLDAIIANKQQLRLDLGQDLNDVIRMAHILAGEPSKEDLINVNQDAMPKLELRIQNIERQVEGLWRDCVELALGGQAALGLVLSAIPGVKSMGREVTSLAARVASLTDATRPAHDRVTERDELVTKASAMADRLLQAGVAPPIAAFLVAVAANPVQLSDLTEEIFAWIREHEALALFSVSTRRA
jgi:hypothetical protein